ncbi:MAG: hypothetical protein B6I24_07575 [Bacteroidetes bacterium 4572_128]|nr:MAG: hypothetical protein B6I24_07575 [Bacteroidetes bacterium 4572_128]
MNKLTEETFKYIYNKYFDNIRRYLYYRSNDTELSTDIAQEVFIKFWKKDFKYNKKTKSLLYKIASNLFVDYIRKKKNETEYLKEIKFQFKEASLENNLEYKELKENYEKKLARLPEKQRTTFLMHRMENLKYKEIAERLKVSIKTVEKRMSMALSELKKIINYK